MPEVFHVRTCEGRSLAEAAARIGAQDEITQAGIPGQIAVFRPMRLERRGGPAMHRNEQRIPLPGVEACGISQPALDVTAIVIPMHAFGFAPARLKLFVGMSQLAPVSYAAVADFRWVLERVPNDRR